MRYRRTIYAWGGSEVEVLFAVVEELIKWALESTRQLFQRLDGRDGVAILNAGNVTPERPVRFSISPWRVLFLAQSAKTIANNHG